MSKSVLDKINNVDLKELGLRILKNGQDGRNKIDDETEYLQITDSDGILDDGTFRCHFELLRIYKTKKKKGHEKDKIYVEVHFEKTKCNKYFNNIVQKLLKENDNLESYPWYKNCPLLRLKENGFQLMQDKETVLSNLKNLKKVVFQTILDNYEFSILDKDSKWAPEFEYNRSSGKNSSTKKNIRQCSKEACKIDILHEKIKENLIKYLTSKPNILGEEYELDCNTFVSEHPVNKINFIDLVAKTKTEKIIFFEIKTAVSARLCIRQAFGQLMEYAYFPNEDGHADKLIVVGTGKKDKNIEKYVKKLNSNFKINIDYLCITYK